MEEALAQLKALQALVGRPELDVVFDSLTTLIKKLGKPSKAASRDFSDCARRMMEVYEERTKGVPSQKGKPWVAGETTITTRLASKNIDLSKYSDDEIVEATKRYINVPDITYKRVLMYFIWKLADDGTIGSDLKDYLEKPDLNKVPNGSDSSQPLNWLYG